MFERFTSHARRVLALAQEEARFLGHGHCGSEHLLLGLIRDEGSAGKALNRQGILLDPARRAVSAVRGRNTANLAAVGSGSLPFSVNAKAAVSAAVSDANASQQPVDTNHLLFGVLRDQSPTVQSVLYTIQAGATPSAQRRTVPTQQQPSPMAAAVRTESPAIASNTGETGDTGALTLRLDELTRRVDHLQAMVNQLSQVSVDR